jgi:hypothetical protein
MTGAGEKAMARAQSHLYGIRLSPAEGLVPANVLRLHVFFPQAPDVELAVSSARLLDATGAEIPHAFLDVPGGLWNADGRTLTLILHPGRIKSGLAGTREAGPALADGRSYSVEVDGGYGPVRLPLRIGPAVTTAIDPNTWRVGIVEPDTVDSLYVQFDRVMDSENVKAALDVQDDNGRHIAGFWRLAADGTQAAFVPDHPWSSDDPRLQPAPDLEDVAGNRPLAAFEEARAPHHGASANVC